MNFIIKDSLVYLAYGILAYAVPIAVFYGFVG